MTDPRHLLAVRIKSPGRADEARFTYFMTNTFNSPVKTILIAALAAAALFFSACATDHVYKAPTNVDVFERAPKSMRVDVTDFSWAYLPDGRLEITGTAKNNTREEQLNVTLFAILFDEAGAPVALGESAVNPALMPPGSKGSFRIVAQTSRPVGIKHLRLLTKAVNE